MNFTLLPAFYCNILTWSPVIQMILLFIHQPCCILAIEYWWISIYCSVSWEQAAGWCDHTSKWLPLQAQAKVCETEGAICDDLCFRRQWAMLWISYTVAWKWGGLFCRQCVFRKCRMKIATLYMMNGKLIIGCVLFVFNCLKYRSSQFSK